jgi:hypothetical protein
MKPVFFDLEMFYDDRYSLRRMSVPQFVLDPRFELLSVAALVDGRMWVWAGDDPAWPEQFRRWEAEGRRFVCHNGLFDFRVLALRKNFVPGSLGDTLCVARYSFFGRGNHGLDSLGKTLFGEGKNGQPLCGKRLSQMTGADWSKNVEYTRHDVLLCKKIWDRLVPDLPPGELELIEHTLRLGLRPLHLDVEAKAAFVAELKARINTYWHRDAAAASAAASSPKMRALIQQRFGFRLPTVDKKKVIAIPELPPEVQQFLAGHWQYREDVKALDDVQKLVGRMGNGQPDQVLLDLNYCGAHSHRWTGGAGDSGGRSFNFQNMRRVSPLRGLLVAPPGKVFPIGDLAQIEARTVAWFAGETGLLDDFERGKDVYCEFGRHVFGHVLDKHSETLERQVCKAAILGLGFGMGVGRFAETLASQAPEAMAMLAGEDAEPEAREAAVRRIVETYRATFPRIHQLARQCFDGFMQTALGGGSRGVEMAPGAGVRFEPLPNENALRVLLPTGGFLTYTDLTMQQEPDRFRPDRLTPVVYYCGQKVRYSVPVENIVQATARDILARMILVLEQHGLPVVFHCHDELVVAVDAEDQDDALNIVRGVMSAPDPRCPGLPICCEATVASCYRKM